MSFPRPGGDCVIPARLESPRSTSATPAFGDSRSLRPRQLPTNHGHAARPSRATRAYQGDSSSKPPHHAGATSPGKLFQTPHENGGQLGREENPHHAGATSPGKLFQTPHENGGQLGRDENPHHAGATSPGKLFQTPHENGGQLGR